MRKVHPFKLRGIWGLVDFGLSGFFFVFCACWRSGVGFFASWCVQDLGLVGVPFFGSRPLGVDRLGLYQLDHLEENLAVHNTTFLSGIGFIFLGDFPWMEAIYASLSGTAQSPWLLCMYGFLE